MNATGTSEKKNGGKPAVEGEHPESRFELATLSQFLTRLLKQPSILLPAGILVLTVTGIVILQPRIFGYAIDQAILPKNWSLLQKLALAYLVLDAIRFVCIISSNFLFAMLGQKVMQELRVDLFSHIQRLPVSRFDQTPVGRLVTRATNDISSLSDLFSSGFINMIQNVLVVIGMILALLALDVKLAVLSLSIFPMLILLSANFSSRLKRAYQKSRSRLSMLNTFLAENLAGMKIIHLFNQTKSRLARFAQLNTDYADAQFGSVKVFALFQPTITVCTGISMAILIWSGGNAVVEGRITPGLLVAAFGYILAMYQPVREISDKWNTFLSGMTSAERIFEIMKWPVELPLQAAAPVRAGARSAGHIRFEHVWFAYHGEDWILKDVSFEILPGQFVGIAGPTGSGKTTLISLLLRFYEPQKGRILLDGADLNEYGKSELRSRFGIIQQDVFLFTGSLRQNITLWSDSESTGIQQFTEQLKSSRFRSLLQKMHHRIGERGTNLSLGERQVIAFARAWLKQPDIWILDEATSSMDSESEAELDHLLTHSVTRHTRLIVAHRLASIRKADLILVLYHGQLMESGTHDELVRQEKLYAHLNRIQEAAVK